MVEGEYLEPAGRTARRSLYTLCEDVDDFRNVPALGEAYEKSCQPDGDAGRVLNDESQNVNPAIQHLDFFLYFFGTERRETFCYTPCCVACTVDAEVQDLFVDTAARSSMFIQGETNASLHCTSSSMAHRMPLMLSTSRLKPARCAPGEVWAAATPRSRLM